MNNNINIAELLKDCPKGMELYSPIFGKVYLDKVRPHLAIVVITDKGQGDFKEEFLYDGRYGMNGECMLYPSKSKTTWEGFVPPCKYKDGDFLTYNSTVGTTIFIHRNKKDEHTYKTSFYVALNGRGKLLEYNKYTLVALNGNAETCLATEEEKQKLFKVIKDNGYRWNEETKTLEELVKPKFKVWDKIRHKDDETVITITGIKDDYYFIQFYNVRRNDYQNEKVSFKDQDQYELVPNKFDIATLKPFSEVLVRYDNDNPWMIAHFSHYMKDVEWECPYFASGACFKQCIPYKGNEHLLGTTNDCDHYYKTWNDETDE